MKKQSLYVRNQSFDIYRAAAVLAVVVGHIGLYMESSSIGGFTKMCLVMPINYGVPLFFIISGYLLADSITRLKKRPDTTYINSIKQFYYLRICRIYPAYIFWLIILFFIFEGSIWNAIEWNKEEIFSNILNFTVHIFNIHNFFSDYSRSINPVFWTLGVEFQWYIIAPLIFYLLLEKSYDIAAITLGTLFILSIASRNFVIWYYFTHNFPINELWRLSNEQIYIELYSFAIGVIIWRFRKIERRLPDISMIFVWLLLLLTAFCTYSFYFGIEVIGVYAEGINDFTQKKSFFYFFVITNMKYISQIILAYIVFHYRKTTLPKFLYLPIQYTAAISYSIYIVHYPILIIIYSNEYAYKLNFIYTFISYLFITFAVSTLSYIFIEKPFLKK